MGKSTSTLREKILNSTDKEIPKKPLKDYLKPSKPLNKPVSCRFGSRGQLERDVVRECRDLLKRNKYLCVKLYTGGIFTGKSFAANEAAGCPDFIIFNFKTKTKLWVEFKRNEGGKLSQEQLNWHSWLKACNEIVFVICSVKELQFEWFQLFNEELK